MMQTLYATHGVNNIDKFNHWRESLIGWGVPLEQTRLDGGSFDGKLEAASVGSLVLTRVSQGAVRSEATRGLIRRNGKDGTVVVIFKLAGSSMRSQDDRSSVQQAGDFVVIDHRPAVHISSPGSQSLFLEIPRERLEHGLGPVRLYTALPIGADLASAVLATRFIQELIRVRNQLEADMAARMSAIGVDLIVASIAERLAREVPRSLHGTVVVQRAKAHVEVNLGDPTLDPRQLAAAVGVSLRRLQELFHERGQHISDWIWHRRLETAAKRLIDPCCAHISIGVLAFNCGFSSQAHFSRRFKDRYGLTPSEYRHAAFLSAS